MKSLRAPFPWFGGKSRAAHLVWAAFGDVPNFVEPFAGSLAVLLARPTEPRIETVNDRDCYLANFWRAVKLVPADVARWADWPVNEADLHARHRWLVNREEFRERMKQDPDFHDAKVAGWWVWGICQWIGGGWCSHAEWTGRANAGRRHRGIHTVDERRRPHLSSEGQGVHIKRPRLGRGERGVNRDIRPDQLFAQRPYLDRGGRGISRQKPDLSGNRGAAGRGVHASAATGVEGWLEQLAERLRRVRVCCGDWTRVVGPAVTTCIGVTGVLLDPPYSGEADRDGRLYAAEDLEVAHAAREWALANGDDPKLRIALCGYDGEHQVPESWQCVAWRAHGGYGNQGRAKGNRERERIWFSPHCAPVHERQASLFEVGT